MRASRLETRNKSPCLCARSESNSPRRETTEASESWSLRSSESRSVTNEVFCARAAFSSLSWLASSDAVSASFRFNSWTAAVRSCRREARSSIAAARDFSCASSAARSERSAVCRSTRDSPAWLRDTWTAPNRKLPTATAPSATSNTTEYCNFCCQLNLVVVVGSERRPFRSELVFAFPPPLVSSPIRTNRYRFLASLDHESFVIDELYG